MLSYLGRRYSEVWGILEQKVWFCFPGYDLERLHSPPRRSSSAQCLIKQWLLNGTGQMVERGGQVEGFDTMVSSSSAEPSGGVETFETSHVFSLDVNFLIKFRFLA